MLDSNSDEIVGQVTPNSNSPRMKNKQIMNWNLEIVKLKSLLNLSPSQNIKPE